MQQASQQRGASGSTEIPPATAEAPRLGLDNVQLRPGGRSARAREAILDAAREQVLEEGYGGLSHSSVAKRAGVDRATVYRRWPDRARLAMDAILELAEHQVPVPDTGNLQADLRTLAQEIADTLNDPRNVRLFLALAAAAAENESLRNVASEFWQTRFQAAALPIIHATERGDLPASVDAVATLEQLIAPLYFRALMAGGEVDPVLIERSVATVLEGLGLPPGTTNREPPKTSRPRRKKGQT
jgi:AcrR family transcriptional regulator